MSSLANTMQNSPNLNEQTSLNSFVLHRKFKVVLFSDKLKPLRNGPLKIINKSAEVRYELLTPDGKLFHTHRKQLIPYNPRELFLFPHIQSIQFYIEKKS